MTTIQTQNVAKSMLESLARQEDSIKRQIVLLGALLFWARLFGIIFILIPLLGFLFIISSITASLGNV